MICHFWAFPVAIWISFAKLSLCSPIGEYIAVQEGQERSSRYLKIKPKSCKGPEGNWGVCMFNYECTRLKGTVLATCVDGFLFGACCQTDVDAAIAVIVSSTANVAKPPLADTTEPPETDNILSGAASPQDIEQLQKKFLTLHATGNLFTSHLHSESEGTKLGMQNNAESGAMNATEVQNEANALSNEVKYDCGVQPLVPQGRIVGGKQASYGRFPWQVLIRESSWFGIFTKNKCGGVLIADKWVISAAHCQPGFLSQLVVLLGEHDISNKGNKISTETRNVKRVIRHKDYVEKTFENDLALLELETPITRKPNIVPICLPPEGVGSFVSKSAIVSGWGKLSVSGPTPTVLQEVDVPIMTNSECHDMFQKAGHTKKVLDSFLCAGYPEGLKDSCEGDSGGPLQMKSEDGRWILVGTVSHGIKCAYPNLPGVYMRMTYYKPWISRVTGTHFP